MIKLGDIGRTGSIIHIDETDDLAPVTVQVSGASKGVNRLYARRLTACYRAMANVSTEWLEENQSIVVLGAPIADRFKDLEKQRDDLLAALEAIASGEASNGEIASVRSCQRIADAAIAKVRGPWCCEKGQAAGIRVCPECAEINDGYQSCLGVKGGA